MQNECAALGLCGQNVVATANGISYLIFTFCPELVVLGFTGK